MANRLLVWHFLRRFLEHDAQSTAADRQQAVSIICAALISSGFFVTILLCVKYLFDPFPSPARTELWLVDDNLLFFGYSMGIMALLAVVTWDALALDVRDAFIFGVLPLSARAVVRVKLMSVLIFASVFCAAVNVVPSLLHPLLSVGRLAIAVPRFVTLSAIRIVVGFAAGAFGFVSVLLIRESCRGLLGAALFRRMSAVLQGALTVILVSASLLLPAWCSNVTQTVSRRPLASMLCPPLWFVGLNELLSGGAIDELPRSSLPPRVRQLEDDATELYRSQRETFRELGLIAVVGLALAGLVAAAAYGTNNRRLPAMPSPLRIGGRGVAARGARAISALIVHDSIAAAGFFFALRSMSRAMPHRVWMAGAIAVGLALATIGLRASPIGGFDARTLPVSLLSAQSYLLAAVIIGFRRLVRIPADAAASWAVRLSWSGDPRRYVSGTKRAAVAALVCPAILTLLPAHVALIGWRLALMHGAFDFVAAMVLIDALFLRFGRLPFVFVSPPGADLKVVAPLTIVALLVGARGLSLVERVALIDTRAMTVALAAGATFIGAMRIVDARTVPDTQAVDFGDTHAYATQRIELSE